ncbi:cation channel protein, putative [Bodo saltans]|uniref:Cation channel protein, putative n=1 Tax=Bodo saltans TaxID=75058 RepID=A0A0S4IT35_BODSA|nr:cation channel protein, putative [Bodo saltans]|eukprot:CUG06358.1 cation channel protein, putative [Bodo saltans]
MSSTSTTALPRTQPLSSGGYSASTTLSASGLFENANVSRQWQLRRQYQRDFCQRLEDDSESAMLAAENADLMTWGDNDNDHHHANDDDDTDEEDDEEKRPTGSSSPVVNVATGGSSLSPRSSGTPTTVPKDTDAPRAKRETTSKRRELREAFLQRTIPLRFMLEYLRKRQSTTKATIDLLLFLPLLFLSLNLFVFRSADVMESGAYWSAALTTNLVDAPVTPQGFHPTDSPLSVDGPHYQLDFSSVRSSHEWSLWLQRVAVPFFYNPLSRTTSPSRPGPPVGQTVLASAVRLRTLRVRNTTCSVPGYLVSSSAQSVFGDIPCYGRMEKSSLEETSSLFEINATLSSSVGGGGGMESLAFEPFDACGGYSSTLLQTRAEYRGGYGCGGYMFYLNGSLSFNDALELTDAWLASGVLDNAATRFVSLDAILYHTALDAFILAELSQEVTEGGSWHAYPRFSWFQVLSADTGSYSSSERTSDAILAIFLVVGWIMFFGEWVVSFRRNRRSLGAYFVDPWTIVNATYLTCVSVALVLTWVQASAGNDAFGSADDKPPVFSSRYSYRLVRLARLYHWTRYFNGIAAVMLLLRVMEYFRLNSRLNILTRTLGRVTESIFGLVVVFCFFVTAFALCGHVLYGSALFAYSTMALSFSTSMLSLMGSFDYAAMRRYDQPLTFVYFWSFIILGLFVLLNFMTAVISTAFDDERTQLRLTPVRIVLRRWRRHITTVRPLQETFHLYVRCVKAFHSISPNVLWNRLVQHVETSIALDELLQHEQHVQRRAEMARRNTRFSSSGDLFGGAMSTSVDTLVGHRGGVGGSSSYSDAQRVHNHRSELLDQLVGMVFLVGAIGKDDMGVITLPHVESIFLAMLRAHDRMRPATSVSEHWKNLDLVETVALERVKTFLTSSTIAGRVSRKSQRIAGAAAAEKEKSHTPQEALTENSSLAEFVASVGAQNQQCIVNRPYDETRSSSYNITAPSLTITADDRWMKEILMPAVLNRRSVASHHHRDGSPATTNSSSMLAAAAPAVSSAPLSLTTLNDRIEQVAKVLSTLQ